MDLIENLILYENENTTVDFKKEEYKKQKYVALLRDVLAMANANSNSDRHIIIGLKPTKNDRGLFGIQGDLIDSATIEQLVHNNIEPEIFISYFPYSCRGLTFGIIKISNCTDRPYLMKKDFGEGKNMLRIGEGYIRKGSFQMRLTRVDYDAILEQKIGSQYFNSDVEFSLITEHGINKVSFVDVNKETLPSRQKKQEIMEILSKKKKVKEQGFPDLDLIAPFNFRDVISGYIPYESRSIETLEKDLTKVGKVYGKHDLYHCFERLGNRCNLSISNKGDRFIEDATIIIRIPKLEGISVADEVYSDPSSVEIRPNIESINYPHITEDSHFVIVKEYVEDIRHQLEEEVLKVDLRVLVTNKLKHDSFEIECELFAKNIKTSIKRKIRVEVVPKEY